MRRRQIKVRIENQIPQYILFICIFYISIYEEIASFSPKIALLILSLIQTQTGSQSDTSSYIYICFLNCPIINQLLFDCPVDSKDSWDEMRCGSWRRNYPFRRRVRAHRSTKARQITLDRPRYVPWGWEFRHLTAIKAGWVVGPFTSQEEADHAFSSYITLPCPLC